MRRRRRARPSSPRATSTHHEEAPAMLATEQPLPLARPRFDAIDLHGRERFAARGAHAVLEGSDADTTLRSPDRLVLVERLGRNRGKDGSALGALLFELPVDLPFRSCDLLPD